MSVSSPPGVSSTASSSNEFDLPGTNYEVIRLLGAGGMGRVYEVEHRLLGSRWAAKVLAHELGYRHDLVRRLVREARLLGRLRHPNLVNVIDVGTSSKGRAYFVMDLLKGRTLRDELRRVWPYPIAPAYRTLQHVLAGLSVAHEAGLIHRDIKPDNVFLCDDGVVKLLDFGIAKNLLATPASGTPLTPLSGPGVMATVRYAAPECIDGQTASVLSDLYSAGVVLWEMLSGALPFDCGTKYRMLLTIVGEGLRPLDNVPPEVRDLVQRAVARDPAQRFPSARAFSEALEDALARMPGGGVAQAGRSTAWQRAERPVAAPPLPRPLRHHCPSPRPSSCRYPRRRKSAPPLARRPPTTPSRPRAKARRARETGRTIPRSSPSICRASSSKPKRVSPWRRLSSPRRPKAPRQPRARLWPRAPRQPKAPRQPRAPRLRSLPRRSKSMRPRSSPRRSKSMRPRSSLRRSNSMRPRSSPRHRWPTMNSIR
jgi:eukaryotic-like serine/threonine-protein kinase